MADNTAASPGPGPAITSIETTPGGTATTTNVGNTTATGSVDVAKLQAKLDAETKRADEADNRSLGLRRNLSTRDRELEQYRQLGLDKLNQTPGYLDPGINTPATPPQGQGMSIQEREEHDQLKYRVKHSDWKTYEPRMDKIINDPDEVQKFVVRDPVRGADTFASLENIHEHLVAQDKESELVRLRQLEADGKKRDLELNQTREQLNNLSVISGGGSALPEGETMDLANMTADEMVLKGMVPYDPRDPLEAVKRKKG